jgi:RNA methyltransferase, TrmH family
MVTKNQIKLIISLQQKKYRIAHKLFIAEGEKVIRELLNSSFKLNHIYCTDHTFNDIDGAKITIILPSELKKMSALNTSNNCLAVFEIRIQAKLQENGLILALDNIKDPGNLGTIIRLCDWFGISQMICNSETVDVYNPKVVQASMGSLTRVAIYYLDLKQYLSNTKMPIYGTFMDGESIYSSDLVQNSIVIMGNEANGISTEIEKYVNKRIAIPRFGTIQKTESLNVASATAIVLNEFKRVEFQ